jgi:hypothetical protein
LTLIFVYLWPSIPIVSISGPENCYVVFKGDFMSDLNVEIKRLVWRETMREYRERRRIAAGLPKRTVGNPNFKRVNVPTKESVSSQEAAPMSA